MTWSSPSIVRAPVLDLATLTDRDERLVARRSVWSSISGRERSPGTKTRRNGVRPGMLPGRRWLHVPGRTFGVGAVSRRLAWGNHAVVGVSVSGGSGVSSSGAVLKREGRSWSSLKARAIAG